MALKAKPIAAPAVQNIVYFPMARDERGWFVAGKTPRGYSSEAEAQQVAERTAADPDDRHVIAVELP